MFEEGTPSSEKTGGGERGQRQVTENDRRSCAREGEETTTERVTGSYRGTSRGQVSSGNSSLLRLLREIRENKADSQSSCRDRPRKARVSVRTAQELDSVHHPDHVSPGPAPARAARDRRPPGRAVMAARSGWPCIRQRFHRLFISWLLPTCFCLFMNPASCRLPSSPYFRDHQ